MKKPIVFGYFGLLLLFLVLGLPELSGQAGLDRAVKVDYRNIRLRDVLSDLSERYGIQFSYSEQFVPLDRRVSCRREGRPLQEVLDILCRQSGLAYLRIGDRIFLKEDPAAAAAPPPEQMRQNVRGRVVDAATRTPLVGATVQLLDDAEGRGTATDDHGRFEIDGVKVGRHSFLASYIGYYPLTVKDIVLISGKELVLEIELQETVMELSEVVVFSRIDKMTPLNEMASVSARPFSIEEAGRYAASFLDPARMARTFAGVTYLSDLDNDIVVRGNGPASLLWRLEGVEIPNPNHYGKIGSSGGAISMLSSNTLANSEFLSGAFPAEYGNTISGVFDLRLRNGNQERRESSLSVGLLGLEASMEGPFKPGGQASYLVNYRYSAIDALDRLGFNPVPSGGVPRYQDLTFKLHLPTRRAGRWTVFGMGGTSSIHVLPVFHPAGDRQLRQWEEAEDYKLGILGLSNFYSLSERMHLKTILLASVNAYDFEYAGYEADETNIWFTEKEDFLSADLRLSAQLNWKWAAGTLFRAGMIASRSAYDLYYGWRNKRNQISRNWLDTRGRTMSVQTYAQMKYQPAENWTLQAGLHQLYYYLNGHSTLEPRLSAQWRLSTDHQVSLGLGKHSFLGHTSAYLFNVHPHPDSLYQPFRRSEYPKSLHLVLGYDWRIQDQLRFRAEAYYQGVYHIATSINPENSWHSIVNAINNYEVFEALAQDSITQSGRSKNLGLELTLEKFFTDGYYFMLTASLYDSKYRTPDGQFFNTRFNGNYIVNLLGGKEFKVRTNNVLGVNGKIVLAGGNRISPIDLEASREQGFAVYYPGQINTLQAKAYQRFDLSISYAVNRPRLTHAFQFEAQNIFNRRNILERSYNRATQRVEDEFQTGIIPNLFYRISF